jgi:hypothetical protein
LAQARRKLRTSLGRRMEVGGSYACRMNISSAKKQIPVPGALLVGREANHQNPGTGGPPQAGGGARGENRVLQT